MVSIQSSPHPLVFKVGNVGEFGTGGASSGDRIRIATAARALDGMQKEALVHSAASGSVWRMVSDEGPYLNGTDLAPFPLAFFTAGLTFSYLSEIRTLAQRREIEARDLGLVIDNLYTMEGSALRGDMAGGALPPEVTAYLDTAADEETVGELVRSAVAALPASSLLRAPLISRFALAYNGDPVTVDRVRAIEGELAPDPAPLFDQAAPVDAAGYLPEIIQKLETAETVFDDEQGAGSSLQAEQKRTLHVRGIGKVRPIGSVFRFLSDDAAPHGGAERAPSGLAYLSAGIAFCFLTQIGRYAHITKQALDGYRVCRMASLRRRARPSRSRRTSIWICRDRWRSRRPWSRWASRPAFCMRPAGSRSSPRSR
jgi:hypothetical protein